MKAFYVDGHGQYRSPMKKFTVPRGVVILFLARANTLLKVQTTDRLEKTLRTCAGVSRLLKRSKNIIHTSGDCIYDQYVAFFRPGQTSVISRSKKLMASGNALGRSSGCVRRLPLGTGRLKIPYGIHMLSEIVKKGPKGIYVIATCRDVIGTKNRVRKLILQNMRVKSR